MKSIDSILKQSLKLMATPVVRSLAFKVMFIVKLQCLYIKEIWGSYLSGIRVLDYLFWSQICFYRGHEAVGKPTGRAIQHRIGGGSNRCQNIRCHHDPPRKQPEGERTGKFESKTTLHESRCPILLMNQVNSYIKVSWPFKKSVKGS